MIVYDYKQSFTCDSDCIVFVTLTYSVPYDNNSINTNMNNYIKWTTSDQFQTGRTALFTDGLRKQKNGNI